MNVPLKCIAFTLVVLATGAAASRAESAKEVDPSGTWRWEHESQGQTVKDVLKLTFDGKKLGGVYQGQEKSFTIADGRVKGDLVSFSLSFEYNGTPLSAQFEGKIKGDEVDGKIAVVGADISQEFPWKAERSLHESDVIGTWAMQLDTPEGTNDSELIVSQTASKKLAAKIKGTRGDFVDVSGLAVKDNQLRFTVTGEFDGTFLTAKYVTKPLGDKFTGTMEYDYGGQVGELTVRGKRKP